MLTEALEKANSGMESQMQFHWAAEDEVSSKFFFFVREIKYSNSNPTYRSLV